MAASGIGSPSCFSARARLSQSFLHVWKRFCAGGQRRSQIQEAGGLAGGRAAEDTHLRREQVRHLFARVAAICSEQADIREGLCRRKKEGEDTPGEGRLVRIERLHLCRLVDVFPIKKSSQMLLGSI